MKGTFLKAPEESNIIDIHLIGFSQMFFNSRLDSNRRKKYKYSIFENRYRLTLKLISRICQSKKQNHWKI
jgi:hypothetical protein